MNTILAPKPAAPPANRRQRRAGARKQKVRPLPIFMAAATIVAGVVFGNFGSETATDAPVAVVYPEAAQKTPAVVPISETYINPLLGNLVDLDLATQAQLNKTRNIKHGKRYTRLYTIWRGMKARCGNPNAHEYENYGGRGIHVCAEWRDDFEAFFRWAMTHGYSANLTIDRINNDKGYAPDNCRWATMVEQRANQRRSICSKN